MTDPIEEIAALFEREGTREYFGEAVSVSVHMLQAGALAEVAGGTEHLIAAALLHDVGHLRPAPGADDRHEKTGARWLAHWFPPEVTEPIRLHVAAKRYLCRRSSAFAASLSEASVRSLAVQGGVMRDDEARAFEHLPFAHDAIALREWDDAAKDPSAATPDFEHFCPLLTRLLRF